MPRLTELTVNKGRDERPRTRDGNSIHVCAAAQPHRGHRAICQLCNERNWNGPNQERLEKTTDPGNFSI